MSKAKELLLECKIKLGVKSDYKLAQALEINPARVSAYMSEKETPDTYTAVRVALILKRDPTELIAIIQAEKEKNPKRQAFWLDFLQHVRQTAKLYMLALIFTANLLAAQANPEGRGFLKRKSFA
jgi:predicted transcriptional regulator